VGQVDHSVNTLVQFGTFQFRDFGSKPAKGGGGRSIPTITRELFGLATAPIDRALNLKANDLVDAEIDVSHYRRFHWV
jgi:hypothetical protein